MSESKGDRSLSPSLLRDSLGEIFAQNVNLCLTRQAELLANVNALTHGWLHRRLEGVDAIRQAVEQMAECRDPAEISHIQRDWLAGVSRRATEDIAALNNGISSMTKKATADFETVARKVTTLNDDIASMAKQATTAFESAPHKSAFPIRTVGEEKLKTGNRPHKAQAG